MLTIGICGGTASGKTTVVTELEKLLSPTEICIISQDAYYKKTDDLNFDEKAKLNFDHPTAIDFDLMVAQLQLLCKGKTIEQPIYNFEKHNRSKKTVTIHPKKIIIIEGILIFNDKRLLDLLQIKFFIDADETDRLQRRIKRDLIERGRSELQTVHQFYTTVKPMHDKFIEPSKAEADYVFSSTPKTNIGQSIVSIIKKHLEE